MALLYRKNPLDSSLKTEQLVTLLSGSIHGLENYNVKYILYFILFNIVRNDYIVWNWRRKGKYNELWKDLSLDTMENNKLKNIILEPLKTDKITIEVVYK